MIMPSKSMPNHGIELIDGIPVTLKGSEMFAFQPTSQGPQVKRIKLGNYDATTKKAQWDNTEDMKKWVEEFQASLAPRSRK